MLWPKEFKFQRFHDENLSLYYCMMRGVGNDFLDIIKYIMRLEERQTGPPEYGQALFNEDSLLQIMTEKL